MRRANKRHTSKKMAQECGAAIAFLTYCGEYLKPLGLSVDTLDNEAYTEALAARKIAERTSRKEEAAKNAEKSAWWYKIYHNENDS